MNTGAKITAFAAVLAASFGAAYGVGATFDPVEAPAAGPAAHAAHPSQAPRATRAPAAGHGHGTAEHTSDTPAAGGLAISDAGYTLDLRTPRVDARRPADLRFLIRDSDGRPLTSYRRAHEKELHLILASRDLTTFRHLHPARAADGTWSTSVTLPEAGDYRVFADFTPAGKDGGNLTLGADLSVAGDYRPGRPAESSRTAAVDGYTVTLSGGLRPGSPEEIRLRVTKGGREVTDLQPYLGAYGHLVALRSGDLAYLHVHPDGVPGDGATAPGPDVSFTATAPSEGSYRLFLDFKHEGRVRTAAFTVTAGPAGAHADGGEGTGHGH
jgi:hypothetical protein